MTWRACSKRPNLSSDSKDKPEQNRLKEEKCFQHRKYNNTRFRDKGEDGEFKEARATKTEVV